jgi:hypothetical protein
MNLIGAFLWRVVGHASKWRVVSIFSDECWGFFAIICLLIFLKFPFIQKISLFYIVEEKKCWCVMYVDLCAVRCAEGSRECLAVQICTASVKIKLACGLFLLLFRYTWQKAFLCRKILGLAMVMGSRRASCHIGGDEFLNTVMYFKGFGNLISHKRQNSLSKFVFFNLDGKILHL